MLVALWDGGHQAACCTIVFSSKLAKTATAKGEGDQLKMGTQELEKCYVLGVIFVDPYPPPSYIYN